MWEVLPDDVTDLLVGEITCSDEESLACRLWNLHCLNMGLSNIAYINPNVNTGIGDLILEFTESCIAYALIRGVQIVDRVEAVDNGTEHDGRVYRRNNKIRLLPLNEILCSLLCEYLASPQ